MMRWRYWMAGAVLLAVVGLAAPAPAQDGHETGTEAVDQPSMRTVGLAASAALTMALSVIGAGYAVGRIGSAAMGAAAEKPELLTRSILFLALAEGLAVLGFAIAMMLVQKI